ncbi:MAG: phosphomannomutase/phosphoglucomutase [Actinomycetota bacterium]|nr:phosphomannomutase/phosphoglucomutase [Actinomycetota bacterium]
MNPETAFKAYDVRGRTDTGELDAELYERAGSALVDLLEPDEIAVGYDCRATSREFFDALARGITAAGCGVIDLGEVPTDAVYYYSGAFGVPGAIITASHNPAEYNGLKLCREGAAPIGAETGLDQIRDAVIAGAGTRSERTGSIRRVNPVAGYIDHLFAIVEADTIGPLKVAVDGGNGMAGIAVNRVFDRIDAEITGLFLEPDGTFPNHPADPLVPENLNDLRALMAEGSYDIGVAFDGDADRAFFLDDVGEPLSGSTVTSLIARRMLSESPGDSIVHNLITSKAVSEIVSESGGTPVRTRVGHSYIKAVMAETGAVFGGEHSGHYYFRENFRADSGMLAMLVLLSVLSEDGRALSDLRKEVERYQSSGEINFSVVDKGKAMSDVELAFGDATIDRLDGLTVDLGREWFNLRPSNTEPLLRLNVEAPTAKRVEQLVDLVRETLEEN